MKQDLDKYIQTLADMTGLPHASAQTFVYTQIAMTMGDLSVEGVAETWLGKLTFDSKACHVSLEPSDTIQSICEGRMDPVMILREITENG